jgi:subtilisin family serine protease
MKNGFRNGRRLTAAACLALFVFACAEQTTEAPSVDSPAFRKASGDGGSTYLLTAGKWNKGKTRVVERAGGTVIFSHRASGIGIATSDDPDFLANAMATDAFIAGQLDEMVEWQPPARVADFTAQSVNAADDTHFPKQWNLQAMEVPAAWAAGYDGTGARVAVIDGGINENHQDLAGQVDVACSASFVPGEPFNSDLGGLWHGSHVAGIVAAADNDFGIVGVAPGATIMGVKALHGGSGDFSWVVGAILFASDPASFAGYENCQRADIINMSLAGLWLKSTGGGFHSVMNKVVNFASSRGVLVISAAGNNGFDVRDFADLTVQPAMAGNGLAISATGPIDFCLGSTNFRRPASYSNYGNGFVTLAGPGGDFVSTDPGLCTMPSADGGSTTFPTWVFDMVPAPCGGLGGNFTCWTAGTSMASPAVAGVAALIVGKYPGISVGKLKAALKKSAADEGKIGHDAFYGHGFVNAARAVQQ